MAEADLTPVYTDGEAYEERNGKWSRVIGRDYMDWLAVEKGSRWLDVGCGTGALCEVILDHCAPEEFVGVDVAEAQLEYARSRHPDDRARFQMDDALSLSFGEDAFDAAVSALVINFLPDPVRMVAEMKGVVRPSGTVAAWTWDFARNRAVAQHISTAISARRSADFKRVDSVQKADSTRPEAMERIFLDAGLENVRTISVETVVTYKDFNDYWVTNMGYKSTTSNFVSQLSDSDQERFKAEVQALVPFDADGTIRYTVGSVGAAGTVPGA